MTIVELNDVAKEYGEVTALQGIDLTVDAGTVVGLAGPNGAGKSTLIDVVLGHTAPTDGTVRVFGHDVPSDATAVRRRTGTVPDTYALYERLSARGHVEFVADLRGATVEADRHLEKVGLGRHASQPVSEYSNGMAQRLVVALALVGQPDLIVLDEPFTGIDPEGIATVRERLADVADAGSTVVLSSHRVSQLSALCDRILTMRTGRVDEERTVDADPADLSVLELDAVDVDARTLDALEAQPPVVTALGVGDGIRVVCEADGDARVREVLAANDVEPSDATVTDAANPDTDERPASGDRA